MSIELNILSIPFEIISAFTGKIFPLFKICKSGICLPTFLYRILYLTIFANVRLFSIKDAHLVSELIIGREIPNCEAKEDVLADEFDDEINFEVDLYSGVAIRNK